MRILFLLLILVIPRAYAFDVTLEAGYLYSHHVFTKNLNDHHPFVRFGDLDSINAFYFHNSFSKPSIGMQYRLIRDHRFALDIGFTSGYTKQNVPNNLWLNDDLMLVIIPSISIPISRSVNFNFLILGEAVNAGISYTFK